MRSFPCDPEGPHAGLAATPPRKAFSPGRRSGKPWTNPSTPS